MRKWLGDPVNGWLFDRLWIYDGDHRLFSLDSNMHRIEEYAYAPGIDLPIATIRGNTGVDAVGYHVQDELGNILGIIENGAYISQTNAYDAWGTPTETGHAYNNQLKWKGLKWEGDVISLYYMRNRWYDYETGRFMSEDPIGLAGGINLYAFAGNDPVNGRDPYGLYYECRTFRYTTTTTSKDSQGNWVVTNNYRSFRICTNTGEDSHESIPFGGWNEDDRNGTGGTDPDQTAASRDWPKCIGSVLNAGVTVGTDFLVVGPAYRAGVRAASWGVAYGVANVQASVARGMGATTKGAYRRVSAASASGMQASGTIAGYNAMVVAGEAQGTVFAGMASGDLSGWDFVPIVASVRAIRNATHNCR